MELDHKTLNKLAFQFVWLLREDLRKGAPAEQIPSPFFGQWWLLQGRSEYPAWDNLKEADRISLSKLSVPFKLGQMDLTLPKAFSLITQLRADVREKFTVNGKLDSLSLAGWFFMLGIKEHALEVIITDDLIRMLDRSLPVNDFSFVDAKNLDREPIPALTVLMRIVWQLLDSDIQKNMSLDNAKSRERFILWFFCIASKLYSLAPMVAERWKCWLQQDQLIHVESGIAVPRFAIYDYRLRTDLKEQFDIDNVKGAEGLLTWSKEALAAEGEWSWLNQSQIQENSKSPVVVSVPLKQKPFGVNLYGFAFGELGIGEDLRMAVAVCESAGIPYRVVNINAGQGLRQGDSALTQHVENSITQAPYAINIFCLPAFDMVSRIFLKMGAEIFEDHYNIGWWPWELGTWPKSWGQVFDLVDEVWSGSSFSLETYQKHTLKPCFLMPLAASVERGKTYARKHFGLPKTPFLFLYVFDFNSSLSRKNPHALVEAFKLSFTASDRSVGLVLKIMNVSDDDSRWLEFKALCAADSRIHILNKTMDRPEVLGLIKVCDAYVSPHRAEGFGRTLAEAMLFGKPVVATNYSGNVDFMEPSLTLPVNYELVSVSTGDYHFVESGDGAVWAEPSVGHLAEQMHEAKLFSKNAEKINALTSYANREFSVEKTAQLLKARLSQIQTQLTT